MQRIDAQHAVVSSGSRIVPHKELVTNAEIYALLRVCLANHSFASCDGAAELFKVMFPDSRVARDVTLQSTKATYVSGTARLISLLSERCRR